MKTISKTITIIAASFFALGLMVSYGYGQGCNMEGMTHSDSEKYQEKVSEPMQGAMEHYFAIRELLSQDKTEGLEEHSAELSKEIDKYLVEPGDKNREKMEALQKIRESAANMKIDSLEKARQGFATLS